MSTAEMTARRWPTKLLKIARVVGIAALLLIVVAGPGYRLGILPLMVALPGAVIGFLLFIIAFLSGVMGLVAGGTRGANQSRFVIAVIAIALVFTVIAIFWMGRLRGVPAIHDISTDLDEPPAFKDAVALRSAAGAVNPPEYQRLASMGGNEVKVPEAQRAAYPDVQPLVLPQPPTEAVQLAHDVARDMGWSIISVVPAEGRVEATDSTFYFGFKDDIVIRVRPESTGSRIDVRSESRVGFGDVGTNAKRVRAFLTKMRGKAGK